MRDINDEQLERWKKAFAKDGIIYDSDDEYREAISNLVGFFEILIDIDQKSKSSSESSDENGDLYVLDKDGKKVIL
jgi:hypothetical protein